MRISDWSSDVCSSDLVCRMKLCLVQLMNDAQYPWLILIPAAENLTEIADLNEKQRKLLINEIAQAERVLLHVFQPHKLNVGALGNMVPDRKSTRLNSSH